MKPVLLVLNALADVYLDQLREHYDVRYEPTAAGRAAAIGHAGAGDIRVVLTS